MAYIDAERKLEWRQNEERIGHVRDAIFQQAQPVENLECSTLAKGQGPTKMPKRGWKPFSVMQRWGAHDETFWLRMKATLPATFKGQRAVARIRIGDATHVVGRGWIKESGEALAYVNGAPTQGIDRNHDMIVLKKKARGGERFDIALECVASTRFEATHQLSRAEIAVVDPVVWDFYWDAQSVYALLEKLEENSPRYRRMFRLLTESLGLVEVRPVALAQFRQSVVSAAKMLNGGLKDFPADPNDGKLTMVGHSHIDTAWLWPLRETKRKVGRTWATVLRLMEQYPEFHFSASQPQLYEYCRQYHPETWKGIQKRVKEGRWELCGATWVEQDSNVPSGESLVRQFLYGNRYYEQEFGVRSKTAWLPDAFGFPWTLPQIMKKAQIETFYTNKIQWCRYSEFPYNYFMWQGADGSKIRAIIAPTDNYNGRMRTSELQNQWHNFKQHDRVEEVPYSFGWGDGGGGPTLDMIEQGKRFANVSGLPQCSFGRTEDVLDRMHAQTSETELPVWNDELYLELHRGCQTTQARTKRNNRQCEHLLKNAEWLSVMAALRGASYDHVTLDEAWKILLTHQFHDILPGSSITQVYADADVNYEALRGLAVKVLDKALGHIARTVDTRGKGQALLVFNPLSWVRDDVARVEMELPDGPFHVLAPDGAAVPAQRAHDGALLFEAYGVPPLGYAVYRVMPGAGPAVETGMLSVSATALENAYLKIRVDGDGRFTNVLDKVEDRAVLPKGAHANVLQFFEDFPHANDAWDIDHNFERRQWEAGKASSVEVIEEGPVRCVLRVRHVLERSTLEQDVTLHALLPRVEVKLWVDWQEKYTLLKAAFPVDVLSSRTTCEIQYGTIERPTHHNRPADRGRFEVTGQHWADLSEGDYGVSLLNDCKYGYDVKDNVLRLSLLRSPMEPDPHADEGEHECTYALYPHGGDWREGTVQQGFELNQPLLAHPVANRKGAESPAYALASVDAENVILDHVKKAEDSDAIIFRLYEAHGQRGPVELNFSQAPKKVTECDLMEENDTPVKCKGSTVKLNVTPYDLRTLKVRF